MKLLLLIINVSAFILLTLGIYMGIEGALQVAVFFYWAGMGINCVAAGILGLCLLVLLVTGGWDEKSEKAYQNIITMSPWYTASVWLQRLLNMSAVVILITADFVWLPSFYLASTIIAIMLHAMMVGMMKMCRSRQQRLEDSMQAIDKNIDEMEEA